MVPGPDQTAAAHTLRLRQRQTGGLECFLGNMLPGQVFRFLQYCAQRVLGQSALGRTLELFPA